MTSLAEIEGVGEAQAQKLTAAGIASIEALLEHGATAKDRDEPLQRAGQATPSRAQLAVAEPLKILIAHEPVSASCTGSRVLPEPAAITATTSTSPGSTSPVSTVDAGGGTRSVASSGTPIVPNGPPSHTYRRPSA